LSIPGVTTALDLALSTATTLMAQIRTFYARDSSTYCNLDPPSRWQGAILAIQFGSWTDSTAAPVWKFLLPFTSCGLRNR